MTRAHAGARRSGVGRWVLAVMLAAGTARGAFAQEASPGVASRADSLFARARQLTSDGNGAAGRAIVDSVLGASSEGSPTYAEALYWRAVLAESATTAQHDYLRLTIEYPASPRAPDALLRLAQLELARGADESALRHLDRLTRDYADWPLIARAHFWRARTLFTTSPPATASACSALALARASVPAGDAELRNQVDFYSQRCLAVDTSRTAPMKPAETSRQAARPGRAPAAKPGFAVQVAAYRTAREASALAARLSRRGLDAWVSGSGGVHRVRIGHHATRTEATAALQELKRAGIDGFVVEIP